MKKKIGSLIILLGLLLFSSGFSIWYFRDVPLLSPITSHTVFRFFGAPTPQTTVPPKVVYGFLPYWNVDTVVIQPELTHLSYFSLGINANGSISSDNSQDGGFQKFKSDQLLTLVNAARKQNSKVEI